MQTGKQKKPPIFGDCDGPISRNFGSVGVYTLIRVESVRFHLITHRPSSFRSNLIAYFMSELFLPQQLHCILGTNTFYVMILDTEDRSKDFGHNVPLQVANHLT